MKSRQASRAVVGRTTAIDGPDELLAGPVKNRSMFPILLLYLLAEQPDHGYGVMERMERIGGDFLSVSTNRIYPMLQRLEKQRFINGEWDHPTKRTRRIYSVTPEGRRALRRALSLMRPHLNSLLEAIQAMRDLVYADPAAC